MIPLNTWATEAINKLEEGKKNVSGRMEQAMAPTVAEQLEIFCRQDAEFAQAVAQGGPFTDCMKEVARGVKNGSIKDLDAYKRAVQFYFPGAKVHMKLTIDLIGDAAGETEPETIPVAAPAPEKPKVISLNLDDGFDLSDFF